MFVAVGMLVVCIIALVWRPIKGVRSLSAHQLKRELQDPQKIYIDVRTPEEYAKGHIKQFQNMPVGSDFSVLERHKEIVVICRSGSRSKKVCKQLKQLGYDKVTNVRGGMGMY